MPLIENTSMEDVRVGTHTDMGEDSWLIQITDPAYYPPIPKQNFFIVSQFEFLDAEDEDIEKYGYPEEALISDKQAESLVRILKKALEMDLNVLVHCHAGICRSGAVVEVAQMMGFTPTDRFRQPNLRVKHKMMKALGWSYDADEKPSSTGGTLSAGGILIPFGGIDNE